MPDSTALRHKVAIVGAKETNAVGVLPTHSIPMLHADISLQARICK